MTVRLPSLQELVIGAAAFLVAWGVIWRMAIQPTWTRIKAVHDVVQRELTPNGGHSIKDRTNQNAEAITAAVEAARQAAEVAAVLHEQLDDVQGSQETIFELLDNIVDRKQEDHSEIWSALQDLGVERRQRQRRRSEDQGPDDARLPRS